MGNLHYVTQNEINSPAQARDNRANMSFGNHNHAYVTRLTQRTQNQYNLRNRTPINYTANIENNNRGRRNLSPPGRDNQQNNPPTTTDHHQPTNNHRATPHHIESHHHTH